jgi:intracellular multiplication protein IcmT
VLWEKFLHLLRGSRIFARPWWYRNRFQDHH